MGSGGRDPEAEQPLTTAPHSSVHLLKLCLFLSSSKNLYEVIILASKNPDSNVGKLKE